MLPIHLCLQRMGKPKPAVFIKKASIVMKAVIFTQFHNHPMLSLTLALNLALTLALTLIITLRSSMSSVRCEM